MSEIPPRPTDSELEILTVLWSRGPCTVREIHEKLALRKPTQYTTVLKMLQIMTEKGLVRRDEKQRAHVYQAARPREWTQKQLAGDLLQRGFEGSAARPRIVYCDPTIEGSAARLLQGALSARKTSKAELAELRRLLDDFEKRAR